MQFYLLLDVDRQKKQIEIDERDSGGGGGGCGWAAVELDLLHSLTGETVTGPPSKRIFALSALLFDPERCLQQ